MDSYNSFTQEQAKELLEASALIYKTNLYYLNTMSLKCAVKLGIPDAIQKHGQPMSINDLATSLNIHPTKISYLPRLMRLLCHNNFFSTHTLPNGEIGYGLTAGSRLLLTDHPLSHAPIILTLGDQLFVDPGHNLESWFRSEVETPFKLTHGKSLWECTSHVSEVNQKFNMAMASDAKLVSTLLMADDEVNGIFKGVTSMVDVGGGNGTMAKAIVEAYPHMKCLVFDLPHVVNGLEGNGHNLVYVAGDMFVEIPKTQVVLLKLILHDWSDEHCIKILKRCKDAIAAKDEGGKVIIIDIVVDEVNNPQNLITQLLFDLRLMSIVGGKQRSEEEWKKLIMEAGFKEYKIHHVLGIRSVIEIYPSKLHNKHSCKN